MGTDLKLLMVENPFGNEWVCRTVITMWPDDALWPLIMALPSRDVPPAVNTPFGAAECGTCKADTFGNTQQDRYGKPLRYVRAHDLASIATHPAVRDRTNRAALAYVTTLAHWLPGAPVVLYWC